MLPDPLGRLAAAVAALAAADVAALPVAAVGEQLTALGHALDQLEAERLRRLAVFDRGGGAAAEGAATTASWLRERSGLAPGAARERVTVARELADRRAVTGEALAAGRISYSAAREIALGLRDAPACVPAEAVDAVEPVLVEQAPALAPGDIRRLLTRVLQALAPDALVAREQQLHARRGVRLSPLGDGWVLSGDLTGECGAALDVALRALTAQLPAQADGEPRPTLPQRRHDALQVLVRGLLDGGAVAGAADDEGDVPPVGLQQDAPVLPAEPFAVVPVPPAEPVAVVPAEPAEPVAVVPFPRAEPPEREALLPVPPAEPAPVPPTEPAPVLWTAPGEVTPQAPVRLSDTGGERPHLLVIADLAQLQAATAGGVPPPGPAAELHGSGPISHHLARRLGCDASVTRVVVDSGRADVSAGGGMDVVAVRALLPPALGGPVSQVVDVGRRNRVVPPATRRAVLARDRGCRWPGCGRPMSEGEVHHLVHWADGGRTDLWNLLLLCWAHHRLLHEGGWDLRLCADGSVELLRPDGTPVLGAAA